MQFDPVRVLVASILIALLPTSARAADDDAATVAPTADEQPVDQKDIEAPEDAGDQTAESDFPPEYSRGIKRDWSTHDFGFMTFRFGIYTLEDWGNSIQSDAANEQIDVTEGFKVRDFRVSLGGKFATSRPITYTSGIMYDGNTYKWLLRETGIQIGFPELWGNLFIGRQKEGISLSKITVGYAVWGFERTPISDATIPILGDGIKWLGVAPNKRANWNFAYYYNELEGSVFNNPSTGWYKQAFVGRFVVLPIRDDATGTLLHVGVAYKRGEFTNGETDLQAKPESTTAPYFIDTGIFPANNNNLYEGEVYFRSGSWFGGTEYMVDDVHGPDGNYLFHGGNIFMTWLMTGEQRPYIDLGGKVGFVEPKRSAFSGGTGAIEGVLNLSYADADDKDIAGGTYWRITPEVNWYLDPMTSLRFCYGLASLDKFGTTELHNFIQARFEIKIQ
jgi:phosphate-selective porin OprO/OprP